MTAYLKNMWSLDDVTIFLDQQGKIHHQAEKSPSGRKIKIIFIFFLITEVQVALIPLHIWREKYILITGAKEVSIMYERKCDYSSMGDAKSWSLIELAARYYNHKKTDGCSPSFLSSVRRHIQYFMVWLKKQGFDPVPNKPSDLTSAILAGYRQMLAENNAISIVTANHYIGHIRMLLNWGWQMHGISHPPIGSISQFSTKKRAKKGHGRKQCRDPLTWDELEKLFSVANVTDSALLMLGLNCGFGNMDIGTLKLSDIDLKGGTISHPRPKAGVERNFILWPETVEILKAYITEYRGKPVNEDVAKLVFVGRKGNPLCWDRIDEKGKMKRSDAVMSRFKRLFEKAGLKRKYGVGFYKCRKIQS